MNRKLFLLIALLALANPIYAAEGPVSVWAPLAAGFGMAIASGLCGLAQAKAVAGSVEAMARNPGASAGIRFLCLLGLILIESLALYTLVIIFAKV